MGSISYEHVLRKVYNCGPTNVYGANAIVYGKMEAAYTDLCSKIIYDRHDKEFKQNFAVVRAYVYQALQELIHRLTETDKLLVSEFLARLKPNFFDKDYLDEILLSLEEMLSKYNGD